MKNNKLKVFSLTTVLMFCLSIFSACTPPMYDLKYDDLKNEILSVELINYNSEKKRADKRTAIMNYNFNYETVIETISQENLQSFLVDFSQIVYNGQCENFPATPVGTCLKLTYNDGSFAIVFYIFDKIWHGYHNYYSGLTQYSQDGKYIEQFDDISSKTAYCELLEKYFNISANEL